MTAERTYLDYNASAPLLPEARTAMLAALDICGNPSSVHAEGRHARALVETAREEVAALVNARPGEVVFTSGATEANAWAMGAGWDTIVVCALEHESVRAPAANSGARLVLFPATLAGIADVGAVGEVLPAGAERGRAVLALQMANNETGVVQPMGAAAELATANGLALHCDAVQAASRMPVDFAALGCDAMSLSSHKIGGPKGAGALVIRDGMTLAPLIAGGGQERRRRAGTENVAAIAGFGAAARAAAGNLSEMARIGALRGRLETEILRLTPEARIIGADAARLANTTCVAWPGKSAEMLVIKLDLAGIAVSAGAACSAGKVGESRVLAAMGLEPGLARSAIRVSLGPETQDKDIAAFLAAWQAIGGGARIAA